MRIIIALLGILLLSLTPKSSYQWQDPIFVVNDPQIDPKSVTSVLNNRGQGAILWTDGKKINYILIEDGKVDASLFVKSIYPPKGGVILQLKGSIDAEGNFGLAYVSRSSNDQEEIYAGYSSSLAKIDFKLLKVQTAVCDMHMIKMEKESSLNKGSAFIAWSEESSNLPNAYTLFGCAVIEEEGFSQIQELGTEKSPNVVESMDQKIGLSDHFNKKNMISFEDKGGNSIAVWISKTGNLEYATKKNSLGVWSQAQSITSGALNPKSDFNFTLTTNGSGLVAWVDRDDNLYVTLYTSTALLHPSMIVATNAASESSANEQHHQISWNKRPDANLLFFHVYTDSSLKKAAAVLPANLEAPYWHYDPQLSTTVAFEVLPAPLFGTPFRRFTFLHHGSPTHHLVDAYYITCVDIYGSESLPTTVYLKKN